MGQITAGPDFFWICISLFIPIHVNWPGYSDCNSNKSFRRNLNTSLIYQALCDFIDDADANCTMSHLVLTHALHIFNDNYTILIKHLYSGKCVITNTTKVGHWNVIIMLYTLFGKFSRMVSGSQWNTRIT